MFKETAMKLKLKIETIFPKKLFQKPLASRCDFPSQKKQSLRNCNNIIDWRSAGRGFDARSLQRLFSRYLFILDSCLQKG